MSFGPCDVGLMFEVQLPHEKLTQVIESCRHANVDGCEAECDGRRVVYEQHGDHVVVIEHGRWFGQQTLTDIPLPSGTKL